MRKIQIILLLISMIVLVVACTSEETVDRKIVLPEGTPDFIKESDFEKINWSRKAVKFGDREIIGNKNKSGVIAEAMKSSTIKKWMWHLWGINKTELTIVGYHKETKTVHPIFYDRDTNSWYWTRGVTGAVNGADSHTPSNVKIPEPGEWAMLLYTDKDFFDILVYEIDK